jgi:hypothetical protein
VGSDLLAASDSDVAGRWDEGGRQAKAPPPSKELSDSSSEFRATGSEEGGSAASAQVEYGGAIGAVDRWVENVRASCDGPVATVGAHQLQLGGRRPSSVAERKGGRLTGRGAGSAGCQCASGHTFEDKMKGAPKLRVSATALHAAED